MQVKDTTRSTFVQLIGEITDKELFEKLRKLLGLDYYVKKLKADILLPLMILAQLRRYSSLKEISSCLDDDAISKALGLDSIHGSTISRRLAALPTEALETLFIELKNKCIAKIGLNAANRLFSRLHLIDSTTISLCVTRYNWADFRETMAGIKAHLGVKVHEDGVIPDVMVMTPARPSDKTQMDAMVIEKADAINVFDRAYLDYQKFDSYCENRVLFVTRLKGNAAVETKVELDVKAGSPIKSDSIVVLGSGPKRMKHPLRLLETEDTQGNLIRILTNVTDLTAKEIGDVYRYRWKIELFFKWLKQNLTIKHFFGQSDQAVRNQLYIALITYCLLGMIRAESGCTQTLLELKRMLVACLHSSFEDFLKRLLRKPSRSSRGRRKPRHDLIFGQTYMQAMAGDTDLFYDVTYDPVIL
ncbi:MAG: IS4 family transposase [Firmicutes bacterium]|nr:IS4 family transposase [Bacillota bacterium]